MIKDSKQAKALLLAISKGYDLTKNGIPFNPKGKVLSGYINSSGYHIITIKLDGKSKDVCIHQLQAYYKFGDAVFESECVRHVNDIRTDNNWDNITLGSHAENTADKFANGYTGSDNINAVEAIRKLTDEECRDVFLMKRNGYLQKDIAVKYNLAKNTLSDIINKAGYYKTAVIELL